MRACLCAWACASSCALVCVCVAVGERISCVWACVCVCACARLSVCVCGCEVGGVLGEAGEGKGGGTRVWRNRKVALLGGLGVEEEGLLSHGGPAVTRTVLREGWRPPPFPDICAQASGRKTTGRPKRGSWKPLCPHVKLGGMGSECSVLG